MKMKRIETIDKVSNGIIIFFALLSLFPLYWLITSSFKTSAAIYKMPPDWFPSSWAFDNYTALFKNQPAFRWIFNSFFVSITGTLLTVLLSSLSAYAFAKLKFRYKNVVYLFFLSSLLVPKEIFVVPLFKIMITFDWIDTYQAMIFPGLATAFGLFMLRGFFEGVPDSIRESGKLDGANELRIFFRLCLPIVKPGIGALFILSFVNVWNDYLWQLLVANDKSQLTLMVGTATLMTELNPNFGYKMAGATVAAIPMIVIFLLFQKYFTRGITLGAVKE